MKTDLNKIKEYIKVSDDLENLQNDLSMLNVRMILHKDECSNIITIEKGKHINENDWDAVSEFIFKMNKIRNKEAIDNLKIEKLKLEDEIFVNGKLK